MGGSGIGSIVGGALSLGSALLSKPKSSGSGSYSGAAQQAAQAAQYHPYDLTTGWGTAEFDEDGYSATGTLAPLWQGWLDTHLFNAANQYDQLKPFYAPAWADYSPSLEDYITGYNQGTRYAADSFDDLTLRPYEAKYHGGQYGTDASFSIQGPDGRYLTVAKGTGTSNSELKKALEEAAIASGGDWDAFVSDIQSKKQRGSAFNNVWVRTAGQLAGNMHKFNERGARLHQWDEFIEDFDDPIYDEDAYGLAEEAAKAEWEEAVANWKSPAHQMYQRLREMAQPGERRDRQSLENRLFQQGMLGSTGGHHRQQAFNEAIGQKDLATEQAAIGLSEQIQNNILSRAQSELAAAQGIQNMETGLLGLGANIGKPTVQAGIAQAGLLGAGYASDLDASNAFWSGLSSQVGGYAPQIGQAIGGLFSSPASYSGGYGLNYISSPWAGSGYSDPLQINLPIG